MEKGGPAGLELLVNYKAIIENDLGIKPYDAKTNPNGYPYVGRTDKDPAEVATGLAAGAKIEPSPIGIQVNQTKLLNLNTYTNSLRSPAGDKSDPVAIATGRVLFRQSCTSCHNDDQSKFVPEDIVAFNKNVDLYSASPMRPDLYPDWNGMVLADRSAAGLVPVRDSTGIFDDKHIISEASDYGMPRGDALPLLMDLARKPSFLHDDEVKAADPKASLALLLDPSRGATAPHPFYVTAASDRAAMVAYLRSLDDQPLP